MNVFVVLFIVALIAIVVLRCDKKEESFVGPKWYKRKNLTAQWD